MQMGTVRMTPDKEMLFETFVRLRRGDLLIAAIALAAGDRHLAEDLVQTTLVRLYLRWPRLQQDNVMAYARRSLVNGLLDHRRRSFIRHESTVSELPEQATASDEGSGMDADLMTALAALPPRMRATIVFRFVDGLSVEETAAALGCSPGTVKSQSARALEKLRDSLTPALFPSTART
jgi:RNA polymerase sigma-70 factor (sigma-E family)